MMNAAVATRTPFGIALNGNEECRIVFYEDASTEHEEEMPEKNIAPRNLQIVKFNLHDARLITYCDGKPISLPDFMAKLTQCVNQ